MEERTYLQFCSWFWWHFESDPSLTFSSGDYLENEELPHSIPRIFLDIDVCYLNERNHVRTYVGSGEKQEKRTVEGKEEKRERCDGGEEDNNRPCSSRDMV